MGEGQLADTHASQTREGARDTATDPRNAGECLNDPAQNGGSAGGTNQSALTKSIIHQSVINCRGIRTFGNSSRLFPQKQKPSFRSSSVTLGTVMTRVAALRSSLPKGRLGNLAELVLRPIPSSGRARVLRTQGSKIWRQGRSRRRQLPRRVPAPQ